MKDIFGKALIDYQNGNYSEDIITSTSISDDDILPLPYLFRSFKDMPQIERSALKHAKGKVLDVGCGAGSHSLYLQEKGLNVHAIDVSIGAVEVSKLRGVKNIKLQNILDVTDSYDTILLLMNGTGIFGTVAHVSKYLNHIKGLLNTNGQILIDSSDIKYMYEDDDGGYWMDTNANYYGELDYFISYKNEKEIALKWLYLGFDMLLTACDAAGLKCELIVEGAHHDYLAKLSLKD